MAIPQTIVRHLKQTEEQMNTMLNKGYKAQATLAFYTDGLPKILIEIYNDEDEFKETVDILSCISKSIFINDILLDGIEYLKKCGKSLYLKRTKYNKQETIKELKKKFAKSKDAYLWYDYNTGMINLYEKGYLTSFLMATEYTTAEIDDLYNNLLNEGYEVTTTEEEAYEILSWKYDALVNSDDYIIFPHIGTTIKIEAFERFKLLRDFIEWLDHLKGDEDELQ